MLGILFLWSPPCEARDFMGELILENYKETQASFSYDPLIYHSIQVKTSAGPKVLVLEGKDASYRKWLRQYMAENKLFILRVDDTRNDEFIVSKAFAMDVTQVHPVARKKWSKTALTDSNKDKIMKANNILVVDPDSTRQALIKTIVRKMGYEATMFKTTKKAIGPFSLQPEKFKLIVVHHESDQKGPAGFVEQILKLTHTTPVVIDTGYKNTALRKEYSLKFAQTPSVLIKPVILRELSKTIKKLIRNDDLDEASDNGQNNA